MEDLKSLKKYIIENRKLNAYFDDKEYTYNLKELWETNNQDTIYSINVKASLSNFITEDNYQKYEISQGYYNKYFYNLQLFDDLEKK